MATQLKEAPVPGAGGGSRKKSKYPWETLLNGAIWESEWGVDFMVKPASFRALIYETARKRDIAVRTQIHRGREGNTWGKPERFVVCQAYPDRSYQEGPPDEWRINENTNE